MARTASFDTDSCHFCHHSFLYFVPKFVDLSRYLPVINSFYSDSFKVRSSKNCVRKAFFAPANGRVMTKMMTKIWPANIVKTRTAQGFQRSRSLQKRKKFPTLTALFILNEAVFAFWRCFSYKRKKQGICTESLGMETGTARSQLHWLSIVRIHAATSMP